MGYFGLKAYLKPHFTNALPLPETNVVVHKQLSYIRDSQFIHESTVVLKWWAGSDSDNTHILCTRSMYVEVMSYIKQISVIITCILIITLINCTQCYRTVEPLIAPRPVLSQTGVCDRQNAGFCCQVCLEVWWPSSGGQSWMNYWMTCQNSLR